MQGQSDAPRCFLRAHTLQYNVIKRNPQRIRRTTVNPADPALDRTILPPVDDWCCHRMRSPSGQNEAERDDPDQTSQGRDDFPQPGGERKEQKSAKRDRADQQKGRLKPQSEEKANAKRQANRDPIEQVPPLFEYHDAQVRRSTHACPFRPLWLVETDTYPHHG